MTLGVKGLRVCIGSGRSNVNEISTTYDVGSASSKTNEAVGELPYISGVGRT